MRRAAPAIILWLCTGLLAAGVAVAAAPKKQPTIADLKGKTVDVTPDEPTDANSDKARQNYQEFLNLERGDAALRAEAMRRLGDLKLEAGELNRIEKELVSGSPLDTSDAIVLYTKLLAAYPNYERNDAVLYQLARAYEADQQSDKALGTLDQLVRRYPSSRYIDEAQFRRGEIMFVDKRWADAEAAYAHVMKFGSKSEFYEQSLYKHGWSLFKRGESEGALDSFAKLLDIKLIDPQGKERDLEGFTRPQRELVEDTLRVCAITFSFDEDAKGVDAFLKRHGSKPYAYLLYGTLGDLYVSKERWTDAADAYRAFAKREPDHEHAPLLQMQAIDAYKRGGFASLVLDGKREYVERYQLGSPFWAHRQPADAPLVVRELKTNVKDLAAYYHSQAQTSKQTADYQEAAHWYRVYLQSFPDDKDAANTNYLLADTLFESHQFHDAALEYEHSAYGYPPNDKSATAGYAALVSYEKHEPTLQGEARSAWHRQGLESGLRFATTFQSHPESAPVLVRTAREYYDLKEYAKAIDVADIALARQPPIDVEKQRTVWTVIANGQFELGQFDKAEGAYLQVQSLLAANDPQRPVIDERIAASVYKQGEARKAAGDEAGAVGDFLRIAQLAPHSKIRASADYDAAALLIGLKDWPKAIEVLEGYRRNFPTSELQPEVTRKLAVAYVEAGRPGPAAVEFERIASAPGGSVDVQREALVQAATLYEKSGDTAKTVASWESYVKRFPQPFEPAMEARQKLADLAQQRGDAARRAALLDEIIRADQGAGAARTDRSRYLAAKASLELAMPTREAFNAVRLVLPLKKSLEAKRAALQRALKSFEAADAYAIAEVSTAATFEMAELYRQLSVDLLKSERPKSLTDEALEQYNLLLEEQAYPFEEKAIEIHLVNTARAAQGLYNEPVRASFAALAKLKPARFAKTEQNEDLVIDAAAGAPPPEPPAPAVPAKAPASNAKSAPPPANAVPLQLAVRFQEAVAAADRGGEAQADAEFVALTSGAPTLAGPPLNHGILLSRAQHWPEAADALGEALRRHPGCATAAAQLGVVYRQLGKFSDAEQSYRKALESDANDARTHRNFGVLLDLYVQKPAEALAEYERSLALAGGEDKQMSAWIAELRQRLGAGQKSARAEAQ
ncbi:MAG TPA: tetratricopeptide repeat protein [Steroidobacteraceae bacterium]|nr:tetratricopeptide repeat protein [Steroidobacteraceae bacterium]